MQVILGCCQKSIPADKGNIKNYKSLRHCYPGNLFTTAGISNVNTFRLGDDPYFFVRPGNNPVYPVSLRHRSA